jgi:peptidoglycan/xylan/chitin deacetylase (PgdA/CDA1 family)
VTWEKFERRASRFLHRQVMDVRAKPSIVSFTFDDVPRSACQIGAELIEAEGGAATFYVCGGLVDNSENSTFFRDQQLRMLVERGHEIGSHGFRHLYYQRCSPTEIVKDLDLNDAYIDSIGLPPSRHFAYPYGSVNPGVKKLLSRRFSTMRGVQNAPNTGRIDRALLKSVHLYSKLFSSLTIDQLMQNALERPTWLIFLSHGVTDDSGDYDIRPDQLETVVAAARRHGLPMMTMSSALTSFSQPTV